MKKKINYYLVATALFVAVATMVSMTVINYYLFQKQVKEDLQGHGRDNRKHRNTKTGYK